ncbi:MAG: hypothetical protein ACREX7_02135 [Casimicrobiaceae bacterium]
MDAGEPSWGLSRSEGKEGEIVEFPDDGWIVTQMRGADFARMSMSKQLSLWAILRAQLSSGEQLAAVQAALAAQKTIPTSPGK